LTNFEASTQQEALEAVYAGLKAIREKVREMRREIKTVESN